MYNKVILIGRLVAAPELHKTSTDKSVARVTVAVNRRYKDQNGEQERLICQLSLSGGNWLKPWLVMPAKGSLISLDGEIRTRRYEKNGVMQYVTEVLCQSFQLLESRAQRAMRENGGTGDLADIILEEEDLPFRKQKGSWFVYRPAFLILARDFIRERLF